MALTGFVLMMLVCHLFCDSCFNRCVMAQTIKLIWSVSEVGILLLLSYMVKVGWPVFSNIKTVLIQNTFQIPPLSFVYLFFLKHLLAMVNQNTLKEKTSSGMQGVNNEWCTLLHLLGCCLLSQAHLQSSWGSTKKKVNEAISCFF
uniref:Uncharacterized protein n=1 Tax=Lactuca sativa TaxID=4236 RepID=A0A9R1VBD3_LACSA|nr:hypothetical protein LSAT_V11C600337480 [Lactuca sativa]